MRWPKRRQGKKDGSGADYRNRVFSQHYAAVYGLDVFLGAAAPVEFR